MSLSCSLSPALGSRSTGWNGRRDDGAGWHNTTCRLTPSSSLHSRSLLHSPPLLEHTIPDSSTDGLLCFHSCYLAPTLSDKQRGLSQTQKGRYVSRPDRTFSFLLTCTLPCDSKRLAGCDGPRGWVGGLVSRCRPAHHTPAATGLFETTRRADSGEG